MIDYQQLISLILVVLLYYVTVLTILIKWKGG